MKQKDKLKQQSKQLADLTFKLQKICQEKESFFAHQFALTSMEFRCLKYIKDSQNISVKDLAANMNLTASRVTYIITSLEEKNLIIREIDKSDRRNIKLKIKDKYIQFVDELELKHAELHEEIFGVLNNDIREKILGSLESMFDTIKAWSEEKINKSKK